MPNYWVVNQGKTFQDEFAGGFLWAPKTNKAGRKQVYYTNLTKIKRGDVVFSFVKGKIIARGTCEEEYKECKNPLKNHKDDWIEDGWRIGVKWTKLDTTPVVRDHMERIRPLLPEKHKFVLTNGNAPQGGYLFAISSELARVLGDLVGETNEDTIEEEIRGRTDIPNTQIERLVKSRCGQGQYRENVLRNEPSCRITGVKDARFLIASHIKPWAKCSDEERLDGWNGVMLTPNADKLFDRGYISFEDDGSLLVSSKIDLLTLTAMIDLRKNVGKFNKSQSKYLQYHRECVFQA
jgi:putative restriction endonuclease